MSTRRFLAVVDWAEAQYPDAARKKPEPPWRWAKLYDRLGDPEFQRLTMPQRGAYATLLMLASRTGNLIPFERDWLMSQARLRHDLITTLLKRGLVSEIELPADSPEVKNLRRILSGRRPERSAPLEREEEGALEKKDSSLAYRQDEPKARPADSSSTKTSVKTPLPKPFPFPPEIQNWALREFPYVNVDFEFEKFIDYYHACGAEKSDWDAALRTWFRRIADREDDFARGARTTEKVSGP